MMHDKSFMDYREFATSEEAHAWANKHYSGLMYEGRFREARAKIIEYTGNTYVPINSVLRVAPDYGSEAYDKCDFGDYEDYRDDIMLLYGYPQSVSTERKHCCLSGNDMALIVQFV